VGSVGFKTVVLCFLVLDNQTNEERKNGSNAWKPLGPVSVYIEIPGDEDEVVRDATVLKISTKRKTCE
jgi:hypothetical protein